VLFEKLFFKIVLFW